ncbi:MAG: hypothetical protein KGO96_10445 [Elusimicrobia bacterium]|nr:hypothetical protein [Elusimicrobiota bacterium]
MLEALVEAYTHRPAPVSSFKVDGRAEAEHQRDIFMKKIPDMTWEVFDARAEDLPIEIDWEAWNKDNEFTPNTLSGVRNKFRARNAPFRMKET